MQSNWQTNFFRGAALDAWRRFVNPENTRADADFLERALHLNPGARLLDVPCGNGRHAIRTHRPRVWNDRPRPTRGVSAKHEGNIPCVHETANLFRFGEFELRPGTRKVTRGGVEIPLSPRPFEVLAYLVIHAGRIVTKDELLTAIWPNSIVEEGNLSQHIFHLRKALDDPQGGTGLIRTVPGRGYEFTAPFSEVLNPSEFYTIPEQPLPTAVFQLAAAGGSL